ncbi:MAG: hypothetical protein EHM50_07695, partial [Lysobacterales bacterium]
MSRLVWLLALLPLAAFADAATSQRAAQLPAHVASDASAAPVTAGSLLESERFWPYHVALTRTLQNGERAIGKGARGVLIRVE